MPLSPLVRDALAARGIPVRLDEPLLKKTWWRVGGPAEGFVEAEDVATLQAVAEVAHATRTELFVLGNASNLLVSDRGIRGLVVRLGGALAGSEELPDRIVRLGGGAKLVPLLKRAERGGWSGLERLAGVPGTVGGAVRMNAGTALGELGDVVVDVDVVLPDGATATLDAAALRFAYRHSELPPGAIVTAARVRLTDDDPHAAFARAEEHLEYRARTQPVDVPTCGSTFRNPPGDRAGRLIEACGLKGRAVGGAVVSEKHANFLVNTGTATADDLRALIEAIVAEVEAATGIRLEPEVHLAGDWSHWR